MRSSAQHCASTLCSLSSLPTPPPATQTTGMALSPGSSWLRASVAPQQQTRSGASSLPLGCQWPLGSGPCPPTWGLGPSLTSAMPLCALACARCTPTKCPSSPVQPWGSSTGRCAWAVGGTPGQRQQRQGARRRQAAPGTAACQASGLQCGAWGSWLGWGWQCRCSSCR